MSTIPTNPPANPIPGAVYVDTATNKAFVWTGTGWYQSSGSSGYNSQITTGAAILPGYFAEPDPSSYIAQVGSEPTNPSEGQIWVNDTVTPSPAYVWHDSAWVKLTDGTFTDTTVAAVPPTSPDAGDSYYETGTGRFYVWDGTAWKTIGESDDTNSIYSMSTPTVRPNSLPLQAGDLWVNSVSGNLSYWSGSTWILISSSSSSTGDTHSMAVETNGLPLLTTRVDGTPLQDGDQLIDTSTNLLYFYDLGAGWKALSSSVTSSAAYYMSLISNEGSVTTRPDGSPFLVGDIIFESNVGLGETYDGAVVTDSAGTIRPIGASIQSNVGAPDLIGSGRVLGAWRDGDLYINKTNNDLYRYDYDTTNWVLMSSSSGSATDYAGFFMSHTFGTRPDGSSFVTGDTIHDFTSAKNAETYTFVGDGLESTHSVVLDGAGTPGSGIARGSGHALVENDFYIDETNSNLYRWDSTAWQLISSGGGSLDATNIVAGKVYGHTPSNGNAVLGYQAGSMTQTGNFNLAIGLSSLGSNTTGAGNVAIGKNTLAGTSSNSENIAIGTDSLSGVGVNASSGNHNIGIGASTLKLGVGESNIAVGVGAGNSLTAGSSSNVLIGVSAGYYHNGDECIIMGQSAGVNCTGNNNILIGKQAGEGAITSNTTIIGTYTGPETIADGSLLLCKNSNAQDFVHLRFNENSAHGVPYTVDTGGVNYGTNGQVLTSQGTTAPPSWTTPTTRSFYTTANVILSSVRFFANQDQWYLPTVSETTIPVQDPGSDASLDGTTINIVAMQTTTPIVFSNHTGSFNFSGGTTSYSWTPSRVGEVLSLSYFKDFYDYGFGIVVAISN